MHSEKVELRSRYGQEEKHKAAKRAVIEGESERVIVEARARAYAATLAWKEHQV